MSDWIKRVVGIPVRFGGVEHSGWLPPGAAKPLPTPIEDLVIDVEIIPTDPASPDSSDDCLLCYYSRDGKYSADWWFETLADAEIAAQEMFGIEVDSWESAPEDSA
jgi:hypothetical protein